jgi:uncharacterized protein (TIGR03118 family)
MRKSALFKTAFLSAGVVAALGFGAQPSRAGYIQRNLVSDIPDLAVVTDPDLKNPWGVSYGPTTPFWISEQGRNLAALYVVHNGDVHINTSLSEVSIPTTAHGPQGPTGQVSNIGGSNFGISGGPARFIFADLNGTIYAWNSTLGTTATSAVSTSGAVYTGLAISSGKDRLYAANTAAGTVDVFNGSFAPVNLGADAFKNPFPPSSNLVPFNVQQIGGKIYVTYAVSGLANMRAAPEGSGAIAVFNQDGTLLQTLEGSKLASPWGMALAPSSTFGEFSGDLLVGNFSFAASEINAFDPLTLAYEGTIPIDPGSGDTSGGLWALTFGNGGNGGNPNILYFSDGINHETDGLFASIAVPEPSSLLLLVAALSLLSLRYGIARRDA